MPVKLTLAQVRDLADRMAAAGATEVEISAAANGKVQYYVTETKVVRRPLKRVGNHKNDD